MSSIDSLSGYSADYASALGSSPKVSSNTTVGSKSKNTDTSASEDTGNTLLSKLSLTDTDNDGMVSISDLSSHLNDLYTQAKNNAANGISDESLDQEIKGTEKMISDFKGWAKELGLGSNDSSSQGADVKGDYMQFISNTYKNDPGLFVDLDA